MKTIIIHARYTDQYALENFLIQKFGYEKVSIRWTRGKYQCEIPKLLKLDELEELKQSVAVEHYQEI
ncbi:uncharacterized protein BDR25DRAFT_299645 [Lindgomyces ingoldianus]|uniref:Uncharacterized protein n=1 Tax=Lindgomyces ingoldianus TaxID=673940 RepID=A0ACB6RFK0_9PLEO|nr:uncharacterized protein BDR25DRAFT_299645 [Lindgomyces ingoldianus]KAF2477887.1 hypothetical protein BDR25DRAFT_299645 [Lindgomyces ingoldianus]